MSWVMKVVHADSNPPGTECLPITIPNHAKVTRIEVVSQDGVGVVDFRLFFQEVDAASGNWTDWAVGPSEGTRSTHSIDVAAGSVAAGVHANCSADGAVIDLRFDLRQPDGTPGTPAETAWATGQAGTEHSAQAPVNSRDPEGNARTYHLVGMLAYCEAGRGITDVGFKFQLIPLGDAGTQLVNLAP